MPNENIFPFPWNSFMLKYHSFQSAQILLGWIMRQMENRKGGASSKCFMLGRINELCRFQPPPTLLISGHLPLILGKCKDRRSHIKLHPPPTQPIQRACGSCLSRLSMIHSFKGESVSSESFQAVGLGYMQNSARSINHFPERLQKYSGFSENGRFQEILYPFLSRQTQEATTS